MEEESPRRHFKRRAKINGGVSSISSLPNEILQQIFSFIPTKLAITTSVLSKRWRHVWRETPSLDIDLFGSFDESISETLDSYTATTITSFRLRTTVKNEKIILLVNSLIKFAMSRNTEKLSLEVCNYSFPDFLFSKSSLKPLSVGPGGHISPSCTVSWASLKSLSLTCVEVFVKPLSEMLSGCPMLESLTLKYIDSLECLDLSKSLRLRRLDVFLNSYDRRTMKIVAPHIYSLRLANLRLKYDGSQSICILVDVSSLNEANIDFGYFLPRTWCNGTNTLKVAIHAMVQTMLEKLKNVENLTLGVGFLQMLSTFEIRGIPFPTFKVKTLTLETRIFRSVVLGLARLLQNSPGLTKITLYAIKCSNEVDDYVNRYLDKRILNRGQRWRLKDVGSPASWDGEVTEPKLVGSLVELVLANTKTVDTMILRLGEYFDRSRFRELSQITHTLSRNNKVSIVLK